MGGRSAVWASSPWPARRRPRTPPVTIENIRVGFRQEANAQAFKVGTWTPVRVDLKGGPERFQGVLEVVVPDDDGTPTSSAAPWTSAPGGPATVTAYVRPGSTQPRFTVSVLDAGGRRRARDVRSNRSSGLDAGPRPLVLTLGRPAGASSRSRALPEFRADPNTGAARQRLVGRPADAVPEAIPGALVRLRRGRGRRPGHQRPGRPGRAGRSARARPWASGSATAATWSSPSATAGRRSRDSFLNPGDPAATMLPALPNGQDRLSDLGALESFAGSNKPIPDGARRWSSPGWSRSRRGAAGRWT